MKKVLAIVFVCIGFYAHAQTETGVDFEADVVSNYYWRGLSQYHAPAIQSDLTFYHKGLSLNLWSINSFDGKYTEFDLTPAVTFGNLTLWASDYYVPDYNPFSFYGNNNFFDFTKDGTCHSIELALEYEAGKLPLNLMLGTFVFGDYDEIDGSSYYSTYFQAGYPFSVAGIDAQVELGITPWEGYYADGFSVVHLGLALSHSIELDNDFSLPLNMSFNVNPNAKQAFVVLGIGLGKSFSK